MDEVERQYPRQWRYVRLLGSCRSTLCIANVANREVAIWDPISDRHSILPPDAEIPHGLGLSVYGFGYDECNVEFVLLRVVQTLRRPIVSEVSIYKSEANVWRRLQGMPYFLVEPGRMGVYLRGRLHWIMRREWVRNSAKVLVAFDIRTESFVESFVEVDQPNVIDNRLCMDLAVLEEHLSLPFIVSQGLSKCGL
ncbi:F-box/kelch-repeat protein At3g23880-like [Eucalyptus grandis]|uniref:F-box/kelch-repeat protein At3g23880-like n=1 Tax=Eucalyptus grandis TaxID=71139 RepID=UPI00192E8F99|nr:F-box/kelch-repeat protein At3g23880-like [Eucalyptus grandis]